MDFRKDINGLRALAVISVVLFHFKPDWVSGGFAGVDVFFVISGFLMTAIICSKLENSTFNLYSFYIARANRIIPALSLLCLVLLIYGYFNLTPEGFKKLSLHAGSSVSFTSNINYWLESGYFESSSKGKWLLHTWSLSVEWQFYIVFPLFLLFLKCYFPMRSIKFVVLFLTALLFLLSVYSSFNYPDFSYYLLASRAWELLAGSLIYFFPIKLICKRATLISYVGVLLIVVSYFTFSEGTPWPGYFALLPVFGTYLVILSNSKNNFLLNNYILQKIGAWSYSIYLWHWPIVVFMYQEQVREEYVYFGILLSILLGGVSYKYIESFQFSRRIGTFKTSIMKFNGLHCALIVGCLSASILVSNGMPTRFGLNKDFESIKKELVMPLRSNGYCFFSFQHNSNSKVSIDDGKSCFLGDEEQVELKVAKSVLFGDSYAGSYEPFFDIIFKDQKSSFQSIVTNWCTPSLSNAFIGPKSHDSYQQCLLNRKYIDNNLDKYENLILAGAWGVALNKGQLKYTFDLIKMAANKGINVVIMAAPFRHDRNPMASFFETLYFDKELAEINNSKEDIVFLEANHQLELLANNYSNVEFISREDLFEPEYYFRYGSLKVPYSFDGNHLSILGSKKAEERYTKTKSYSELLRFLGFSD